MTYRTLLLSYFNGDANLNFAVMSSNYDSIAVYFNVQNGWTSLKQASFCGHWKVVELLLGAGANPDLQDEVKI